MKRLLWVLLLLLAGGSSLQAAPARKVTKPAHHARVVAPSSHVATIHITCPLCEKEGWKAKILAEPVPIDARGVSHGLAFNLLARHQASRNQSGGISHKEFVALYYKFKEGKWEEKTLTHWSGTNYWYDWQGGEHTRDGINGYSSDKDSAPLKVHILRTSFGARVFRTTCNNPLEGKQRQPPPATPRRVRISVHKVAICTLPGCKENHSTVGFPFSLKQSGTLLAQPVLTDAAGTCTFGYEITVVPQKQTFDVCEELTAEQKAAGWEYLSAASTHGVTTVTVDAATPDTLVVNVTNLFRHKPPVRHVKLRVEKMSLCTQPGCVETHPTVGFPFSLKENGNLLTQPILTDAAGICTLGDFEVGPNDRHLDVCEELSAQQQAAGWEFLSARATAGVTSIILNDRSPDVVTVRVVNLFRHHLTPQPPPPFVSPPFVAAVPLAPIPPLPYVMGNGHRTFEEWHGPQLGFYATQRCVAHARQNCPVCHPPKGGRPPGPPPFDLGQPPGDPRSGRPPTGKLPPNF